MGDKIRVGFVGASATGRGSGWGARTHIPTLQLLPEYELLAVCTAHEDTAQASAEAFGAKLAYHDINDMVANPDIDLVVISVRVPAHHALVMPALAAGKNTFCEWPLAANLSQAEEMTQLARAKKVHTAVGLQTRSDPLAVYAKELIEEGRIGDLLTLNLSVITGNGAERSSDRAWQAEREAGAHQLSIGGGHALDALCFIFGEFAEVSARLATRIKEWRLVDTGGTTVVHSPDTVGITGSLVGGAEVVAQIASVAGRGSGWRLEAFGTRGSISLGSPFSLAQGQGLLLLSEGNASPEALDVPARLTELPEGVEIGPVPGVMHAYLGLADALQSNSPFEPSFEVGLTRHRLLDAIERSAEQGRMIQLGSDRSDLSWSQ